jgi:hypothetical protein
MQRDATSSKGHWPMLKDVSQMSGKSLRGLQEVL